MLLDGKETAKQVKIELKEKIKVLKESGSFCMIGYLLHVKCFIWFPYRRDLRYNRIKE